MNKYSPSNIPFDDQGVRDWEGNYVIKPATPAYYRFPNCQVVDISEHLTSNGGQALQYIARSTRLDGANKGEPIQDLRKARDFIEREIERLKETP